MFYSEKENIKMSDSDKEIDTEGVKELKQEVEDNDDHDEDMTDDNIMKILVASDIHLGYEQTTKRGNIFF